MRAPKGIHCELCVAEEEEAVVTLLYPYSVQVIILIRKKPLRQQFNSLSNFCLIKRAP
jgi:hypothetical protein